MPRAELEPGTAEITSKKTAVDDPLRDPTVLRLLPNPLDYPAAPRGQFPAVSGASELWGLGFPPAAGLGPPRSLWH